MEPRYKSIDAETRYPLQRLGSRAMWTQSLMVNILTRVISYATGQRVSFNHSRIRVCRYISLRILLDVSQVMFEESLIV